jgi:hypothetical protein
MPKKLYVFSQISFNKSLDSHPKLGQVLVHFGFRYAIQRFLQRWWLRDSFYFPVDEAAFQDEDVVKFGLVRTHV